jgi:hypothetical protein
MNTLADNLANIEKDIMLFPKEQKVEVEVQVEINDDVPDGYVDRNTSSSDYSLYEKVVDAQDGTVTKNIRLLIHD